ncbi:MAG: 4-hydroxythreonine-4-phosphate dehydrogenase PdxA [Dehalococcoidales bacterium]|nr:4-hydroxythreonine-4-phosphate dehydrogenase PdxA [Dehalococcoidales bacterium]
MQDEARGGRPLLALTMGDPAGIGPEVVLKALARPAVHDFGRCLVVGSVGAFTKVCNSLGLQVDIKSVGRPGEGAYRPGMVDVLEACEPEAAEVPLGEVSAAGGRAAMASILRAADLVRGGEADALVTAPINKEATRLAGFMDVGHLELLARLTGATEYATMLTTKGLRVVHLSTHYELIEACRRVTKERVLARIRLTDRSFRGWGFSRPRIAVAALNPHAGEGGLFGRTEIDEIGPAVQTAVLEGIDARGPFPADSVFNRAIGGEFDVVLAMYHDQGHIPIKVHGFAESVSVALGLPFVRTSVDHGTAFDIAGKGIADEQSMVEAIRTAAELAANKS